MITKRLNTIEQFSTFLLLIDSQRNSFIWKKDLRLRKNINQIIGGKLIEAELIARNFLTIIKTENRSIIANHLTAYLQESCYWAAKEVYAQKQTIVNQLTLEECFSSGNEITVTPIKILLKYNLTSGSKITTYAQTRLKTIITEAIYRHRQWKLVSNWGLLKKMSKSKRKQALTQTAGLQNEQLQQYLLVWLCYCDHAVTIGKKKYNRLSAPNSSQLKLMTSQYNLLAKKNFSATALIDEAEFKNRLEFCGEKARLFTNPTQTNYEEEKDIKQLQASGNYLVNLEENQQQEYINQILINSFHQLDIKLQGIAYLYWGLVLTQQEIVNILQLTAPNFIQKQYQFSRKIKSLKEKLFNSLYQQFSVSQKITVSIDNKTLLSIVQQWLQEYIETQILLLCHQSYQQLDPLEQESLNQSYQNKSLNDNSFYRKFNNMLEQKIASQLNLKIVGNSQVSKNISLWLEKFFHQNFNRIN